MINSKDIFNKTLQNFVNDFASGDAIRHLADKGLTVSEITEHLSFPMSKEKVRDIVWKHYIETGVIRLDHPDNAPVVKVSYVREYDKYGKSSFRRVEEKVEDATIREYVPCDFGKALYNDKEQFIKKLSLLEQKDKDYILDLPWPLQTVWHVKNDRMIRVGTIFS